jgi:hypothetical protein
VGWRGPIPATRAFIVLDEPGCLRFAYYLINRLYDRTSITSVFEREATCECRAALQAGARASLVVHGHIPTDSLVGDASNGRSRRIADVADQGLGRFNWAESGPTASAGGRTAVRPKAGIPSRARIRVHREAASTERHRKSQWRLKLTDQGTAEEIFFTSSEVAPKLSWCSVCASDCADHPYPDPALPAGIVRRHRIAVG